jgi:hypothetical protein
MAIGTVVHRDLMITLGLKAVPGSVCVNSLCNALGIDLPRRRPVGARSPVARGRTAPAREAGKA